MLQKNENVLTTTTKNKNNSDYSLTFRLLTEVKTAIIGILERETPFKPRTASQAKFVCLFRSR